MELNDSDGLEFQRGSHHAGPAPVDEHGERLDARNYKQVEFLCPKCGGPTEFCVAKKSRHAGRPFYGCERFPDCDSITETDGTIVAPFNQSIQAENYRRLREAEEARTRSAEDPGESNPEPSHHEWGPLPF